MQSQAAICWEVGEKWSVEEVEYVEPRLNEVLVRVKATGLCHSDDHAITGDMPTVYPIIGGHEGAGVVEAVGPGVTGITPGQHVVLNFIPPCGRCRQCATGHSNLCSNQGAAAAAGIPTPVTTRGQETQQMGGIGTFSEYTVVPAGSIIPIDDDIPLEAASLLGCAVTTGWGAATYLAETKPGDTVVVIGSGGVGINSVQGAKNAGAAYIVAVDTNEFKREQAIRFGATHAVGSTEEAQELVGQLTKGRGADAAILSVGVGSGDAVQPLVSLLGTGGIGVLTSVTPLASNTMNFDLFGFTLTQKTLRGNVYGGVNVFSDVPLLLDLYRSGKLLLDELVTARYSLADINAGYADMHAGKNLRGVVTL